MEVPLCYVFFSLQDFVALKLGQHFIEPQTAELGIVFRDSSPTTPLIFVLSVGTDPAADLYKFAEEASVTKLIKGHSEKDKPPYMGTNFSYFSEGPLFC